MPIEGLLTYLPVMLQVLLHWQSVNTELGAPPNDLKLQGGFTRAMFQALHDALDAALQELIDIENARETASNSRDQKKEALLLRIAQFRGLLRGLLANTIYPGAAPLTPQFSFSEGRFLAAFDDMSSLWARINADTTIDGFTPPLALPGMTFAEFVATLADLRAAYAAVAAAENDEDIGRKRRDAMLPVIRERIIQYRELVAVMFGPDHPLTLSLPALSPNPGSTPDPVEVDGQWNPTTNQAEFSFTPSDDPNLEEYVVYVSSGPTFNPATARIIAHLPPGTTTFSTTEELENPGDVASFKVFVKLTTGNQAGSNTVTITRP
ncbi:MAG: hypothetical protein H7062_17880 [Candidatus Saccharimonas sp.]|nr:hypothetical protein [Planctomycetaceae bacterium]